MKSIKEKAIEVFPSHCNANTDLSNFKKRIGFNSGANYVLEEIDNVIKSDRILWHQFPSLEMRYNQIISVIEQLKK